MRLTSNRSFLLTGVFVQELNSITLLFGFGMKLEHSLNSKLNIMTAVCCKYFTCPSSLTWSLPPLSISGQLRMFPEHVSLIKVKIFRKHKPHLRGIFNVTSQSYF